MSGHKSLSGLAHYKRVPDSTKISMSTTLSTHLRPDPTPSEASEASVAIIPSSEVGPVAIIPPAIIPPFDMVGHVAITPPSETVGPVGPVAVGPIIPSSEATNQIMPLDDFGLMNLDMNLDMNAILAKKTEAKTSKIQHLFSNCSIGGSVTINFNPK